MLVRDLNTDIREEDEGSLTVIARYPKGKDAIVNFYESNKYQRLKAIRPPISIGISESQKVKNKGKRG